MFEAFAHFLLEEHLGDHTFVPPAGPIGYPRQLDPARQKWNRRSVPRAYPSQTRWAVRTD